jgi:nitric oxide reductase large subunit
MQVEEMIDALSFCTVKETATMKNMQSNQRGGSAVGTVILLAALGFGAFVGLQYIPQKIQNMTLDSILDSITSMQQESPAGSVQEVQTRIDRLIDTNEMDELRDNFKIAQDRSTFIVTVSREWKLNLLYTEKVMKYERILTLK